MSKQIFKHTVRVPYAHVDQMGFVYYANYFVYFEMARSELLRDAGFQYSDMEARGVMLPVLEAHCKYNRAANFDDLLEIRTHCESIDGTRIRIEYEMIRLEGKGVGDLIVTGYTIHICMSPEGKVLRPADELKSLAKGAIERE
ncbi:MAG: acyl-CoA thioesterase [Kiritimatiellae bacterium]|nr:acyl-CoA thioesterase [Kiritimatiellia bacterium]